MFSPSVVGSFGISKNRLETLNSRQKQDLLAARLTLMKFLKASQSHLPNIRRLVDPVLMNQFPDQTSLLNKLFGQESEVLLGAVTDFELNSPNEIELGYYVVLFTEGNVLLRDDKTVLRRRDSKWVIARIGGVQ